MSIQTVSVPVPASGDGPIVDVSALVGPKTVQLSGNFRGYYDLLASQDDANFDAVASFDAGGDAGIEQTVPGAFKSFRLRANVSQVISPVSCEVSAVLGAGENGFGTVASLAAGFSGLTPAVDTSTFVPPTGSEVDTCFLCRGAFEGPIVVLGSSDGVEFNPVGSFVADRLPEGAPPVLEFAPLTTLDKTRYVRLQVPGTTTGPVVVTVGGRVPSGAAGTPMAMFVVDGSGTSALQALAVSAPTTFGASSVVVGPGSSALGAVSVAVGSAVTTDAPSASATAIGQNVSVTGSAVSVAVGSGVTIDQSPAGIALGLAAQIQSGNSASIAIGQGATVATGGTGRNTAVGPSAVVLGGTSTAIGANSGVGNNSTNSLAVGQSAAVGPTIQVNQASALGSLCTVDSGRSIAAGASCTVAAGCDYSTVVGSASSVSAANGTTVGTQNTVSAGSDDGVAVGYINFIDASSPDSVSVGSQNSVGTFSTGAVCVGLKCQVGTTSASSIVVGTRAAVGNTSAFSVAVGNSATVSNSSPDSIAVGNTASVGDSSLGVAIGANALVGNGVTGIAISGQVRDGSQAGIAIGGGSIVGKNTTGCLALGTNPQVLDNSTNAVVIGRQGVVGTGTNAAVVVGLSARSDYTNSQAYGAGATTSQADEVVFGTPTPVVGGGAGPLRLFHAYTALNGKELLRFDSDALASPLDSAMYLLYKDGGGTVRFSKVTVQATTGFLKVSPV